MSKALVTGAGGFIGRSLAARLEAEGWEVAQLTSACGDIAVRETLTNIENNSITHVFHLAGKTFVPDSWDDPLTFCQTNVVGTINVLELCRKMRTPLTYVSSYVYGHPDDLPVSEDSSIRPNNPYALTKRMAEESCEFYANVYGLPVTIIRPFNVYGIGQQISFLIPAIISQALDQGNEIIVKDLLPKRDYVYLEDLVTALVKTTDNPKCYRVYNIGSGVSLSVREVIDVIQEVANTNKSVVCETATRANELMDVFADITRAKCELGWFPETPFRTGIEEIIRYQRKRNCNDSA